MRSLREVAFGDGRLCPGLQRVKWFWNHPAQKPSRIRHCKAMILFAVRASSGVAQKQMFVGSFLQPNFQTDLSNAFG